MAQQFADPFRELRLRRNQAQHQIPIPREIIKMPRMHHHRLLPHQLNRQLLIRPRHRNPQHRIPSAFNAQPLTGFLPRNLPVKFQPDSVSPAPSTAAECLSSARATPAPPTAPAHSSIDKYRQSPPTAPSPPSATSAGPLVTTHATFICGNAEIFDNPLSVNVSTSDSPQNSCQARSASRQRAWAASQRRAARSTSAAPLRAQLHQPIIQKHFIRNHRQPVLAAKRIQQFHFPRPTHKTPSDYWDALPPLPASAPSPPSPATENPSASHGHKSADKAPASHPANPPETQTADNSASAPATHPRHCTATETQTNTPHWCW